MVEKHCSTLWRNFLKLKFPAPLFKASRFLGIIFVFKTIFVYKLWCCFHCIFSNKLILIQPTSPITTALTLMWSRFINKKYFQFTHSFAVKVYFHLFYCNICVSYYCVWIFCVRRGPFKWLVLLTFSVAIWHLKRPNQPTLPKIKWFGHLAIFWPFSDFEEK